MGRNNKKRRKEKKRRRARKQKRGSAAQPEGTTLILYQEYYTWGFRRLLDELVADGYSFTSPSAHRSTFWSTVARPGRFTGEAARDWLNAYYGSVERELRARIERHSIAYWHHILRRFAPTPFEEQPDEATTLLSQMHLEAAVLKYGQLEPCSGVGLSSDLEPADILDGRLAEGGVDLEQIRSPAQVVLRRFTKEAMAEFTELRKLAHEIWLVMSSLRCVGKGAVLVVEDGDIFTDRGDELNGLLQSYDKRPHAFGASAAAVVIDQDRARGEAGRVLIPQWNVGRVPVPREMFGVDFGGPPNFIWLPMDLRQYLHAHLPLSARFRSAFGFRLETLVAALHAVLTAHTETWTGAPGLFRAFRRAYATCTGPAELVALTRDRLETARGDLDLGADFDFEANEVEAAVAFLTLTEESRAHLDLGLGCLMPILFPWGWNERTVVDYAWLDHWLFWIVTHPRIRGGSEGYKGALLEDRVGGEEVVPSTPCRTADKHEERQIDASYARSSVLVVCECRAIGRSGDWERAKPQALRFRQEKVEKLLSEADEKAAWLARHVKGGNFDVSGFTHIFPVAVTPFTEYIWSNKPGLWIDREANLPRILTPLELEEFLERPDLEALVSKHPACVLVGAPADPD